MKLLLFVLAFVPSLLFAQSRKQKKAIAAQKKLDQQVIANLKNHVQYFLSNPVNGQVELMGEASVISYITDQFKLVGLQPKGSSGYIQEFKMDLGKQIDAATYLKVNETGLEINKDYIPLAYSATKNVTGMPAMALREKGVPWFADVKDWVEEKSQNRTYNFDSTVRNEVLRAAAKGATALFLYNSSNVADSFRFDAKDKNTQLPIPVVYVTPGGYKKYFSDHEQILDIDMNIAFKEIERKRKNVVGYIDNGAGSTIIIGASYDNAETQNKNAVEKTGHSGTNATRTAILIEVARMLISSPAKKNNYVFIALGGEDREAQASKFWLQNSTINAAPNYMVHLEKVDIVNEERQILVGGQASSELAGTIAATSGRDLQVLVDTSLPLSETVYSFYQKNIPVLNVTTPKNGGTAGTGADNVNYEGELLVARFLSRLIEATDAQGKLAFSKVTESQRSVKTAESEIGSGKNLEAVGIAKQANYLPSPKTSVSLGIIPDKNQTAEGLRISGVSPKKPASKLGLQPGDILTYLGTFRIADMNSYMHALSNFKAGDKTVLRIKREKEEKEFAVEF